MIDWYANDDVDIDHGDVPSLSSTTEAMKTGLEGYVSWPKRQNHLSFDRRMLHAASLDL